MGDEAFLGEEDREVAHPIGAEGCAYIRRILEGCPGLPAPLLERMNFEPEACYAPLLLGAPKSAIFDFEAGGIFLHANGSFLDADVRRNAKSLVFLDLWAEPQDLTPPGHEEIRGFHFEGGVGYILLAEDESRLFWQTRGMVNQLQLRDRCQRVSRSGRLL